MIFEILGIFLKWFLLFQDCGAKIVSANPESQGASNVLSGFRDEYMLNKCTDRSWFVVELCESIKALKIEMANFELYSSVPHEFRVSLGNAFPAREKDWTTFGTFKAEDERAMQTFSADGDVFGKFVKVEIMSHHGSEHYCPISQFKIFGISEIELIGSDGDDDDDDSNDDVASVVTSDQAPNTNDNNVLKFIKDKVGETFERVVGVFKPKDQNADVDMQQALNESSLIGTTFAFDISCPECSIQQLNDVYFFLANNFGEMSKTISNANIQSALTRSGICANYGIDPSAVNGDYATTSKYLGHSLVNFYTTLFGTSRIVALCNVLAIERGLGKVKVEVPKLAVTISDKNNSSPSVADVVKSEPAVPAQEPPKQNIAADPKLVSSVPSVDPTTKPAPVSASASFDSDALKETPTARVKDTIITDTVEKVAEPILPTPVSQTTNGASVPPPEVTTKEPEMKDLPEVVLVPPSDSSHIHLDDDVPSGNGQKAGQGGRESVWQKLSNRIKVCLVYDQLENQASLC